MTLRAALLFLVLGSVAYAQKQDLLSPGQRLSTNLVGLKQLMAFSNDIAFPEIGPVPFQEKLCRVFYLKNDTTVPLTITKITFGTQQTSHFTFREMVTVPAAVSPDEEVPICELCVDNPTAGIKAVNGLVYVSFVAGTNTYTNHRLYVYGILEEPSQVNKEGILSSSFSVNPNPTNSLMTFSLSGVDRGELVVSDILGNIIYRSLISGTLIWNGINVNGIPVAPGSYLARVQSMDETTPFVTSKLILIQ